MNIETLWRGDSFNPHDPFVRVLRELHTWLKSQNKIAAAGFFIGQNAQTPSDEDVKKLRDAVVQNFAPLKKSVHYARALVHVIDQGNQQGLWKVAPPGIPIYIAREASPFLPERMPDLALVRRWRDAHQAYVREGRAQNLVDKRNSILACAALNGGLLNTNLLAALYTQLGQPLEVIGNKASVMLSLRWRGQDDMEQRRWFPDALTELLLLCLTPEEVGEHQAEIEGRDVSVADVRNALLSFFRKAVEPAVRPKGITALFNAIDLELRAVRAPAVLADYAARSCISHSLKPHVWQRIHGFAPSTVESLLKEQAETQEQWTLPEPEPSLFEHAWMVNIRKALRAETKPQAIALLDQCLGNVSVGNDDVARLFVEWSKFMLKKQAASRKPLARSTIRSYFGLVGARVAGLIGTDDISSYALEGLEEVYQQVLEDAHGRSHLKNMKHALCEFHRFLAAEKGVERLNADSVLGIGAMLTPVDANLISFDEYQAILDAFDCYDLEVLHPDLPTVGKLIFMLGFRAGLRRLEVLKLRLEDLHEVGPMELVVRPHENRRLKTKSSTRKLPLYALLSEEEQQWLWDWKKKRVDQEKASPRFSYLFSIPAKGYACVPEATIFSILHRIMRDVTRDSTLRFHHLRHSFASWALLRLMLSDFDQADDWFPHLPETTRELRDCVQFRERLYGHGMISRKHVYAVSTLLGHSGPDISLEHYVHVLDILTSATLKDLAKHPSPVLVSASGLKRSTVYKKMSDAGVEGLLKAVRKKRIDRVHVQMAKPTGTAPKIQSHKIGTLTNLEDILDRVWKLLYRHSTSSLGLELLADRFGFSTSQCEAMINAAQYLAGMKVPKRDSQYRHRMKERLWDDQDQTTGRLSCPEQPGKTVEQEVFKRLVAALSRLLDSEPDFVDTVLHQYVHHAWKSQNEYILHNLSELPIGQAFLLLLKKMKVPRRTIQFLVYGEKQDPEVVKAWREGLGLSWREKLHPSKAPNPKAQAVARWFGIKPLFPDEKGSKSNDGVYGFRYLLIMTWIYLQSKLPQSI